MLQPQGNKLAREIFSSYSYCSKVCDLLTQCPWGDCTQKAQEEPVMPFTFICEEHGPDRLLDDPPTVIKSNGFSDITHTGEQIRKPSKPRSILCFRRHYKQRQDRFLDGNREAARKHTDAYLHMVKTNQILAFL